MIAIDALSIVESMYYAWTRSNSRKRTGQEISKAIKTKGLPLQSAAAAGQGFSEIKQEKAIGRDSAPVAKLSPYTVNHFMIQFEQGLQNYL